MSGSRDAKPPVLETSGWGGRKRSIGNRLGVLLALFVTGYAPFINLYVTQPLLPQFRNIFHASELMVSLTISAPVLAVALAAPRVGLLADALGRKGVIFACQAAASSYVGKAAGKAHSLAASLYVALYYLGGSIGSIIPDFFWEKAEWFGCVALILCMQGIILFLSNLLWKDWPYFPAHLIDRDLQ